jgi:hypothetical protein
MMTQALAAIRIMALVAAYRERCVASSPTDTFIPMPDRA